MILDTEFDGAAIDVLDIEGGTDASLALRGDVASDHLQWFCFRANEVGGRRLRFSIENVGDATFPQGFENYRVCASDDGESWFRVPTTFDGDRLIFEHRPRVDSITYSYFATYSHQRHEQLIARARRSNRVSLTVLGSSVEGRDITALTIGTPRDDRRNLWIIARQHPGETMAEWFAEGVIDRLLDRRDELSRALLERAVIHIVPSMNPDGGVLGNLRTNALGTDLNRSWLEPDEESSPEVACVRSFMIETGVDCFLDIHGDERNPWVFAAGNEGNPSYSDRIESLEDQFANSLMELDWDFQRDYGYPRDLPGEGDLSAAANWVGENFDCLALTVEMPFKDAANRPRPRTGWSPQRAMGFGQTVLEATFTVLDDLR